MFIKFIYKHSIREYHRFQECRANIIELANTLESQKASHDSYAYFYKRVSPWGLYTGSNSAGLMLSGNILMDTSDMASLHLPQVKCPLTQPLGNNIGNFHVDGRHGYKKGDMLEYSLIIGDDCYTLSCWGGSGRHGKKYNGHLTYSRVKGKYYSGFTSEPCL